jgi:RNA polymerase primary sigma factor
MNSPEQPEDLHEALFIADFHPGLGAYLARQHARGYDPVAGRARFLLWLAAHSGDGDGALRDNLAGAVRTSRLSAEEETELAARIAEGRRAQEYLARGGDALTDEARGSLRRVAQDGSEAGNRLLEANRSLVVAVAERFAGRGLPFPDLVQEGNLGLVRAIEKYDRTKHFRFTAFATWWIRQAIAKAVAGQQPEPEPEARDIDELALTESRMLQMLGREPTPEELAAELDLSSSETSRSPRIPGQYRDR